MLCEAFSDVGCQGQDKLDAFDLIRYFGGGLDLSGANFLLTMTASCFLGYPLKVVGWSPFLQSSGILLTCHFHCSGARCFPHLYILWSCGRSFGIFVALG